MEIEDFTSQVAPRARRSKLTPRAQEILALKSRGYTDAQISQWLATVGIKVTRQSVQQFVSKLLQEKEKQPDTHLVFSNPAVQDSTTTPQKLVVDAESSHQTDLVKQNTAPTGATNKEAVPVASPPPQRPSGDVHRQEVASRYVRDDANSNTLVNMLKKDQK